jgi:predicted transcriptional regulator
VAIVRRGGFTRAAGVLHLSQPAVSRRLELHHAAATTRARAGAGARPNEPT